jgi:hypothetical protein
MESDTMLDGIAAFITRTSLGGASPATPPAIRLESCGESDRIVVKTRQSVYELIVLAGESGEVMVRGGKLFPEFRRAAVVGSTLGHGAVRLRTICVGLRLEFRVDRNSVVTSRIECASRHPLAVSEA